MEPEVKNALNVLWDYMLLRQPIRPVDVLIVLGSRDDRVAAYAAELMKQNIAPVCVISGGSAHHNDLLAPKWSVETTESEHFADVMQAAGISKAQILLESEATHTGENAILTYKLLKKEDITSKILLIVTKPYMERRALATFEAQYPDKETSFNVTSVGGTIGSYCNEEQPLELVANIMVGDFQRIIEYPKSGLQTIQQVPAEVFVAFETLTKHGYTQHLIK